MRIYLSRFIFAFWVTMTLLSLGNFSPTFASPGLSLSKSSATAVTAGANLAYDITCSNYGEFDALNVVVKDTLPNGVNYVDGSATRGGYLAGRDVTFKIRSLPSGSSITLRYHVQVPLTSKIGSQITSGTSLATSDNAGSAAAGSVKTTIKPASTRTIAATGPGKVVYTTSMDADPSSEIYMMNADGTNITRLTDDDMPHFYPALSPDGTKVIFVGHDNNNGQDHIYVINAAPQSDSNPPIQLTNSSGADISAGDYPGWSPNGRQIVYSRGTVPYITDLTPVSATHQPLALSSITGGRTFAFSPDGTQLAFSYFGNNFTNVVGTATLNLDSNGNVTGASGGAVQRTSSTLNQYAISWSSDGTKIFFVQEPEPNSANGDLFSVNLLDRTVTRLSTDQKILFDHTSCSPDGSLIAFASTGPGQSADGTPAPGIPEVYVVKPAPITGKGGANYPLLIGSNPLGGASHPSFAQAKGASSAVVASVKKTAALSADTTAASVTSVEQGKFYFYRLNYTVKNSSTTAISGVTIKDLVPTGTVYIDGADTTESDGAGGTRVIFDIGSVSAGETITGTVAFRVSEFAPAGTTITNAAKDYFVVAGSTQANGSNDVNLTVTSGPAPALGIVKTLLSVNGKSVPASTSLAPDDELVYLLRFTNTGTVTAKNVVVTDPAPSHTFGEKASFSDALGTAVTTPDGDKVTGVGKVFVATYTIGELAPGQFVYATMNAKVLDTPNGTAITNSATMKADNATQVTGAVTQTVSANAIVSMVNGVRFINGVTAVPNEVVTPSDIITYIIKYTNSGTRAATNAVITDPFPANTHSDGQFFSDADGNEITAPPGGSLNLTSNAGILTFTIPRIAPKSVNYVTIKAFVNQDAASKATRISNTNYTLTADGGINITNQPAIINPLHAPLAITKKVLLLNGKSYTGSSVRVGDVLTYQLTVTNPSGTGAKAVQNVSADDFEPAGTTIRSAGTGTLQATFPPSVKFSIANLLIGQSVNESFSVTVGTGTGAFVKNSNYGASIDGVDRRFVGKEVDTPVFNPPALTLTKTAKVIENGSSTQVAPGQNVRYVLTVTNSGGTAVTNVRLADTLPADTVYNQAFLGTVDHPVAGATPVLSTDGRTVSYVLGSLAPGASVSASLEVQVKFGTTSKTIVNSVYSASADGGLSATGAPVSLNVIAGGPVAPQLKLQKVASVNGTTVTQVSPGDALTYDFTYSNANPNNLTSSLARGVTISETLPTIQTSAGTVFPAIVSSTATYANDGKGHLTWNIGDLGSLKGSKISLKLTVPSTTTIGSKVTNSDYHINGANMMTGTAGAAVTLSVVAPKLPSPAVVLAGVVDDSQPKTTDGKLLPGAQIQYTAIARNNGDGTLVDAAITDLTGSGLRIVDGSASFDSAFPATIKTGTITYNRLSTGDINGVVFEAGDMPKRAVIVVHFTATVQKNLPVPTTSVSTDVSFSGKDTAGKFYSVTSNTDVQPISIPNPLPARLALSQEFRRQVVVRNSEYNTILLVSNVGGQAAHNILLRYTFQPNGEQVMSATDGGQKVSATQTVNTIVWDGTGSSQQSKFLTLNPGECIAVQLTSKSSTRTNQTMIVGDVADVHEKSSATSHGAITNPVTRLNLPNIPVVNSIPTQAALTQSFSLQSARTAASSPSFLDNLTWIFQTIGAKIGSVLFGGNTSPAVQKKIASMNLRTSVSSSAAAEDFLVMTCALSQTVKVTPIIPGVYFQVSGPENLVHIVAQGGGNIVAQGGGNIVAQGGGNAISVDTLSGNQLVSQFMAKVVSNDGGTLRNSSMMYFGGSNTLIGQDGNGLIGQDGNGLRLPIPAGLVNTNGSNVIAAGGLIGQDGNGAVSQPITSLIGQDGNGIVAQGGGNIVGQGGGNIVAQGGGNAVNLQGNNSFSVTTGN